MLCPFLRHERCKIHIFESGFNMEVFTCHSTVHEYDYNNSNDKENSKQNSNGCKSDRQW